MGSSSAALLVLCISAANIFVCECYVNGWSPYHHPPQPPPISPLSGWSSNCQPQQPSPIRPLSESSSNCQPSQSSPIRQYSEWSHIGQPPQFPPIRPLSGRSSNRRFPPIGQYSEEPHTGHYLEEPHIDQFSEEPIYGQPTGCSANIPIPQRPPFRQSSGCSRRPTYIRSRIRPNNRIHKNTPTAPRPSNISPTSSPKDPSLLILNNGSVTSSECPHGGEHYNNTNICLILLNVTGHVQQQRNACKSIADGDLASILSQREYEFVQSILSRHLPKVSVRNYRYRGPNRARVGLARINGMPYQYDVHLRDLRNPSNCTYLSTNESTGIYKSPCASHRSIIALCQYNGTSTSTTTTTTTTTTPTTTTTTTTTPTTANNTTTTTTTTTTTNILAITATTTSLPDIGQYIINNDTDSEDDCPRGGTYDPEKDKCLVILNQTGDVRQQIKKCKLIKGYLLLLDEDDNYDYYIGVLNKSRGQNDIRVRVGLIQSEDGVSTGPNDSTNNLYFLPTEADATFNPKNSPIRCSLLSTTEDGIQQHHCGSDSTLMTYCQYVIEGPPLNRTERVVDDKVDK